MLARNSSTANYHIKSTPLWGGCFKYMVVRSTYLNFYFMCPARKIKVNGMRFYFQRSTVEMGAFFGKSSVRVAPSAARTTKAGVMVKALGLTRKKNSPPKKSTTRRPRSSSKIDLNVYPHSKSPETNHSNRL